jgi:hypothetical protein
MDCLLKVGLTSNRKWRRCHYNKSKCFRHIDSVEDMTVFLAEYDSNFDFDDLRELEYEIIKLLREHPTLSSRLLNVAPGGDGALVENPEELAIYLVFEAENKTIEEIRKETSRSKGKHTLQRRINQSISIEVNFNGQKYVEVFEIQLSKRSRIDYKKVFPIHKLAAVLGYSLRYDDSHEKST